MNYIDSNFFWNFSFMPLWNTDYLVCLPKLNLLICPIITIILWRELEDKPKSPNNAFLQIKYKTPNEYTHAQPLSVYHLRCVLQIFIEDVHLHIQ